MNEQERQLRSISDTIPIFIVRQDGTYRLRFVNKSNVDRFGIRLDDTTGNRAPDILGEEAMTLFSRYVDAAHHGWSADSDARISAPGIDDSTVQIPHGGSVKEDNPIGDLYFSETDLRQTRRTGKQQLCREREFKMLVENSHDLIVRIDRDMRNVYANSAIEKIFGMAASAFLGKTIAELGLPTSVTNNWNRAVEAVFRTGGEQHFTFEYINLDTLHTFTVRVLPETDRDGRVESALAIAHEISDYVRMERERDEAHAREANARIQAEAANRTRDDFLVTVSHELRAPLNGIQSWTHVIENHVADVAKSPLAQRALHGIKTGVEQQVRLIEDLLDVTRIMNGKLRLAKHPLALLPVVQAAVESLHSLSKAKQIGVSCTYNLSTEKIDGDPHRVQQIVWHLLSNAIKFTPLHGNVWLTVSEAKGGVRIVVRDDGIGVSPEDLPHLFNRFSNENTSSIPRYSGLRLGLYLVQNLTKLHTGSVKAESAGVGKGATFSVYLPFR